MSSFMSKTALSTTYGSTSSTSTLSTNDSGLSHLQSKFEQVLGFKKVDPHGFENKGTLSSIQPNLGDSEVVYIRKRDGSFTEYDPDKISERIKRIIQGSESGNDKHSPTEMINSSGRCLDLNPSGLIKKVSDSIYSGISTETIDNTTINIALSWVQNNPDWDIFAGRLFLSNESKKLRNFTMTERYQMLYHGTWAYIFDDYDVRREMGKIDGKIKPSQRDECINIGGGQYGYNESVLNQSTYEKMISHITKHGSKTLKRQFKSVKKLKGENTNYLAFITAFQESLEVCQKRILACSSLSQTIQKVNRLFSLANTRDGHYKESEDGPYIKPSHHISLPDLNWNWIPSTAAKYLDDAIAMESEYVGDWFDWGKDSTFSSVRDTSTNGKQYGESTYNLLFGSETRPKELNQVLFDRTEFVKKNFPGENGRLRYDRYMAKMDKMMDPSGRVVSLHSILDCDYFYIIENFGPRMNNIASQILEIFKKNCTESNSSYRSILGRFSYCLKSSITKRYFELPHESILRCAVNAVIGQLYDDFPDYVCYWEDQDLTEQGSGKIQRRGDILLSETLGQSNGPQRSFDKKCFIHYELFSEQMWKYFFDKLNLFALALINDAVTLPTPTQRNSGTRNNQGTSCFLIHMIEVLKESPRH
jgi:ATP cone domain